MNNIVSNCPLCGEHSLHLSNDTELNFQQCISCGYVSSDKFLGKKEDNEEYQKFDKLLQSWVKETDGRIWIPIQMSLPFGMVYPALVDNADSPEFFDNYAEALKRIQSVVQEETQKSVNQNGLETEEPKTIKLPKLKKVK